jgi:cytochrome c oxidase subunit II
MKKLLFLALFATACGDEAAAPPAEPAPAPVAPAAPVAAAPEAAAPEAAPAGTDLPGKAVYNQYCVACHQADGKGMNGTLAGNFVDQKERLAQSDEALLKVIAEGKLGTIGQMPAWGTTLSEEQRKDVLAYIRATYGGA